MSRLVARTATVLALALAACGDDDPPTTGGETLLTSPASVTGIAGGDGSQRLYRIVVPAGATEINVTTTGGTGDVDVYLRAAQPPSLTVFDCRSDAVDNEEFCSLLSPAAGNWYIMLFGFEAYSGVTLSATVSTP